MGFYGVENIDEEAEGKDFLLQSFDHVIDFQETAILEQVDMAGF